MHGAGTTHLDGAGSVDEDIGGLKVTMDDVRLVQMTQPKADLRGSKDASEGM